MKSKLENRQELSDDQTRYSGPRHCPVHGGWSDFKEVEGECSETCTKKHVRTCSNPEPAYGGNECQGDDSTYEFCQGGQCNECFELNIKYPASDISWKSFGEYDYSVVKVQKVCQETENCKGFTINGDHKRVYLKNRLENRVSGNNLMSGPDICIGKYFVNFQMNLSYNFNSSSWRME